jgi:hypothetical protein
MLAVATIAVAQLAACSDSVLQPTASPHPVPAVRHADVIPGSPNLIVNGSFEATTSPHVPGWSTFCQGSTALPGWSIGGTDCVDVHWGENNVHWTNIPDGQQALDLNGSGVGAVLSQAVAGTKAGHTYRLSLDVSDNPACAPAVVKADVRFGGAFVTTIERSTTNSPIANMTWDHHEYTLTAPTDDATLSFTATVFTSCGIVLDHIQLVEEDVTPPAITYDISGTAGENGWYTSTVVVTWHVKDDDSPVTSAPCDPVTIDTDTPDFHATCSATSAGGSSSASVDIARDATAPTFTFSPDGGSFAATDNVAISCTASDALSGVANPTCAGVNAAAYTFGPGTHTVNATATDNAGNTGSGSTTFTVTVSEASLCSLVNAWVTNAGNATSLCVKLKQKSSKAFVNEVGAQTGKAVPADKAPILISFAQALLDH